MRRLQRSRDHIKGMGGGEAREREKKSLIGIVSSLHPQGNAAYFSWKEVFKIVRGIGEGFQTSLKVLRLRVHKKVAAFLFGEGGVKLAEQTKTPKTAEGNQPPAQVEAGKGGCRGKKSPGHRQKEKKKKENRPLPGCSRCLFAVPKKKSCTKSLKDQGGRRSRRPTAAQNAHLKREEVPGEGNLKEGMETKKKTRLLSAGSGGISTT